MKYLPFVMTSIIVALAFPAQAAPFTYSPEKCDFKITFPEKPFIENKCPDGTPENCTEIVTYVHVMDIGSSSDFRVTCIPASEKEVQSYTTDVMKGTLKKMLSDASLEPYNIEADEKDGIKRASSISVGKRGDKEILYAGQLWIGKKSILSFEAEMLGPSNDKLNEIFANILRSVTPKLSGKPSGMDKPQAKSEPKVETKADAKAGTGAKTGTNAKSRQESPAPTPKE